LNAAAAFAVSRWFQVEPGVTLAALASFQPPDMRLTRRSAGDVSLIDDSYNANPCSMAAALATLMCEKDGRRVFVAGDMAELGDESMHLHAALGRQIAEAGIEMIVGVGPYAASLVDAASRSDRAPEVIHYEDAERAGQDLPGRLRGGDTVLVKGSRVVGLERLVQAICAVHQRRASGCLSACRSEPPA
jgi:UDP-N-acetylmuramyl pentapeptide synthase